MNGGSVFYYDFCSLQIAFVIFVFPVILFCAALSNVETLQRCVWEPGGAPNPSCSNSATAGIWLHRQRWLESTRNTLIFSQSSTVFISLATFLIHLEYILNTKWERNLISSFILQNSTLWRLFSIAAFQINSTVLSRFIKHLDIYFPQW